MSDIEEITKYKCPLCNKKHCSIKHANICLSECQEINKFLEMTKLCDENRDKTWYVGLLREFCNLVRRIEPWIYQKSKVKPETALRGIVGRYLCDGDSKLWRVNSNLLCICPKCFETKDQPYNAINCQCGGN